MSAESAKKATATLPAPGSWPLCPEATLRLARLEVGALCSHLIGDDDTVDLSEALSHTKLAGFLIEAAIEARGRSTNTPIASSGVKSVDLYELQQILLSAHRDLEAVLGQAKMDDDERDLHLLFRLAESACSSVLEASLALQGRVAPPGENGGAK